MGREESALFAKEVHILADKNAGTIIVQESGNVKSFNFSGRILVTRHSSEASRTKVEYEQGTVYESPQFRSATSILNNAQVHFLCV